MISRPSLLGPALLLAALAPVLESQAPPRPQPYCIQGVALDRDGQTRGTLLLADGSIRAVLDPAAPVPPGMRVIDGSELICLPAFLDAYSRQGVSVPTPVQDQDLPPDELADVGIDMRLANRKGIQPAFQTNRALAVSTEQSEAWRKSGFGAVLIAPGGELLAGTSALASTRAAAMRDLVLREAVYAHGAFSASGPGYPSTLMGYFAQLRQFLMDCRHQVELERRYEQRRPGPRPPFDADLDAGAALLSGGRTLLCEAQAAADILRWFRLADEFGLSVAIAGGLEAWRVTDELSNRSVPVVLTLDWGKEVEDPRPKNEEQGTPPKASEPEVAADAEPQAAAGENEAVEAGTPRLDYEEPDAVRLERRLEWERGRDCALRLQEAGIRMAFGTAEAKPSDLLKNVRALVKAGLSPEAALAALTTEAAQLLGIADRLGKVEAGFDATFTLWRKDPLTDEKATPAWIFVDGYPTEFPEEKKKEGGAPPAEGLDPTGTWELEFAESEQGMRKAELVLEMEEGGGLSGQLSLDNPMSGERVHAQVEGQLSGDQLELEASLEFGEFKVQAKLEATVTKEELEGDGSFRGPWSEEPTSQSFRGKRVPK